MIIFVNTDGTISTVQQSPITQGSNGVQKITLIAPSISQFTAVTVSFILPDLTEINGGVMSYQDITIENVLYKAWIYTLTDSVTNFPGTVLTSFSCTDTESNILATYTSQFTVVATTATILPSAPTTDWYAQVLAAYGQIQGLYTQLNTNKQDKTDSSISLTQFPTQKTVVGSINDIGGQVATNTGGIDANTGEISTLGSRVTTLENTIAGAETPVGQMTGFTLPTNAELTTFTVTQLGRQPKANDSIIFILEITGQTNKNYKYIYYNTTTQWQSYEIPPIEQAGNGSLGTIKGTYGVGSTNNLLVNISSGEITDFYYKDNNGIYQNMRVKINLMDVTQTSIIDGSQTVGISTRAIQDQLGNIINLTYAKQSDVYTKTQSDNKYLPNTYTNIYYYATSGFVDDVPTTPASGIQFTKTISAIGTHNIFTINRTLENNYHFTKNSTDKSAIWVGATRDCILEFKLTTSVQKSGQQATILSIELTGEISLTANTPMVINIPAVYSSLGNTELDASVGDLFIKTFEVITTESTSTTIDVYSNSAYPSTFNLNAQSIVFDINTIGGLKEIGIVERDWIDNGNGTYSVTILQTRHQQAPGTNYVLELQKPITATSFQRIAFTPSIDTSGNITITAYNSLDCTLLIGSAIVNEQKQILTLTNPTVLPNINYNQYGALRVIQTETATALTLLNPTDTGKFYTFFVSNDQSSTQSINFNGEIIDINSGMQFKWNGNNWQN